MILPNFQEYTIHPKAEPSTLADVSSLATVTETVFVIPEMLHGQRSGRDRKRIYSQILALTGAAFSTGRHRLSG